jgi:Fe-S oxidoreductase
LNLKDKSDLARMRRIMEEVSDLVLEFGGSLSGEHGDGLARSEWNRKMFGPVLYDVFRQIKRAFDPDNVLNPGKVVDAPSMTENLRYHPGYAPADPLTVFDYSRQEGFVRSIELCNGSGVCRKLRGGAMCPSFRATLDEKDSTRARANALRLALADRTSFHGKRARWVREVLDLCLMCKACKSECPSNVDMAKLKAEFLQSYYDGRPRPLGHRLMAQVHRFNRWGAMAAPVVNWLQTPRVMRWLLEKLAGIDRRRSLPSLHRYHFRRWFARHTPLPSAGHYGRVLLLDDCFNTFSEPEIGQAAVRVLEGAGYTVELAGITCCCRPLISKGFVRESQKLVRSQLPRLASRLGEGVPLLGLEPSCALTLADEWPELVPGADSQAVAASVELSEVWLARQAAANRSLLMLKPRSQSCLLHGHCHQKALRGVQGTVEAMRLVPDLDLKVLDAGCCGMAGSFGFEREHYDVSVTIAKLALLPAIEAEPEALIIAPGTSCRHQIRDLAGRQAVHPMQVLEQAMSQHL